jgi:hypothetical protein
MDRNLKYKNVTNRNFKKVICDKIINIKIVKVVN